MSYYENMKRCSKCRRKTKAPRICPLGYACEAPLKCHAQIGIGVATLGATCIYDEGHPGPHSYYPGNCYMCKKHPDGCPNKEII